MIPPRLQNKDINFCLIGKGEKKPFQTGWQNKDIKIDDTELLEHLIKGGNYGVRGGGPKKLLIVDFDIEEVQKELVPKLPKTFTVKTGRGLLHKYYFSNKAESFKIFTENKDTILDVQGEGKQVVGPGSIHPNGNNYEVIDDSEIVYIDYAELKALIMPYDKNPKKEIVKEEEKPKEYSHDNFLDIVKSRVSIEQVLREFGTNTSINPSNCPFHDSKGGKCLGWKDETAHCFHCDGKWNVFSLVKEKKSCNFNEALLWLVDKYGLQKEYQDSKKKYVEYLNSSKSSERKKLKTQFLEHIKNQDIANATEIIVNYILSNNFIYSTKEDVKSEMWIYKEGVYIPQGKSEVKEIMRDVLEEWFNAFYYNQVIAKIEADTFIESQKFFSTNYKSEIPVQNGILNVVTRELTPFCPEKIFFNKLPVIYDKNAKCPNIEKFLSDILKNPEDKLVFYELAGSGLYKEYKYEKSAMFVGNGRNGKGKSLELIKRLVGAENCASIPLSNLTPDSFSISELFGKLFNIAGDIGNKDLQDTSMFKSLSGRDLVSAKRKFLTSLHFENYAKFIFACNELPTVYDSSRGFWERWVLMEFPYTFVNEEEYVTTPIKDREFLKIRDEDIISKIITPDELSGLLNEALNGLSRLSKNHNFSVTAGTKEIKEMWIRKSNSVVAFIMDYIEEDYEGKITKKEFRHKYAEFCKKHGLLNKSDFVIKKVLQEMFGASEERTVEMGGNDYVSVFVWTGVKWKK